MKRLPFAALICAVTLAACSDRESPTQPTATNAKPAAPAEVALTGKIILNPTHEVLQPASLVLLQGDGSMVALTGSQTGWLQSVMDADAEVRGTIDDIGQLVVDGFTVLAMNGAPAHDGMLTFDGGSYALLPLSGGPQLDIVDPPDDLKVLAGSRVWIVEKPGEAPTAFGAIEDLGKWVIAARAPR